MDHLTAQQTLKILRFLQSLYVHRTHAEFTTHIVAAIPTVISTDVSSYNEVNSKRNFAAYYAWPLDHPSIPNAHEIFGRYASQHPMIAYVERTKDMITSKFSDFLSQREFRTTDLYNEFYRPLRLPYTMGTSIAVARNSVVAIALNRATRDFAGHDLAILNLLRPHLIQAFHNMAAVTRMQEQLSASQDSLESRRQGLVSVTQNGHIRFSTPTAEQFLARYDGDPKRNKGCLPPLIYRWLQHESICQNSEAIMHSPGHPLRINGPHGVLTIRWLRQYQQTLLLLEEIPFYHPRDTFQQSGLSPRESEILTWVVKGKTNPEIGLILGISRRTVHKHLERIYSKLGVENRHAAISLILSQGQPSL